MWPSCQLKEAHGKRSLRTFPNFPILGKTFLKKNSGFVNFDLGKRLKISTEFYQVCNLRWLACSAGVFWVGETLFVFVILFLPPSLILWQWKIGESRNSNPYGTLTVGARAKEGNGGGGEEKKKCFLFSLLAPSPLPLIRPISSSPREVSTWRVREQIAR